MGIKESIYNLEYVQYIVEICAKTQKLCGKTSCQIDQLHKQKIFPAVLRLE